MFVFQAVAQAKKTLPKQKAARAITKAKGRAAAKPKPVEESSSSSEYEGPASSGPALTILSEKKLALGQKLTVVQSDITTLSVDAIVNPTNASFSLTGEVATALKKAGVTRATMAEMRSTGILANWLASA